MPAFCFHTIIFTKLLKQTGEHEIMDSNRISKMILPYLKPKQGSLNWQLESLEENNGLSSITKKIHTLY